MATGISIKGIVAPNGDVHHFDHEYLDNNPPIPEIDTGLDTSGEAADAAAVGQAIASVEGAIPEIDMTLSVAGKAADGKATGDAIDALKEDLNVVSTFSFDLLKKVPYDYTNVEYSHFGITSSGKWTSGSVQRSYTFDIPENAKAISVTANATGAIIAFLNTYEPVALESVDFADRYGARIVLSANETREFIVHGNTNYFYALLQNDSAEDKTPSVSLCYENTDDTLTQEHVPADSEEVGKRFGEVLSTELVDYSNVDATDKVISSYNKWSSGFYQRSFTFPIGEIKRIKVTGNATNGSIIAFLDTYPAPVVSESPDFATAYPQRIVLSAGETVEYSVVGDMHYLYAMLKDSSSNDYTPTVEVTHLPTDKTFTREHVPADAKATGDAIDSVNSVLNNVVQFHLHNFAVDTEQLWSISASGTWITWRTDEYTRSYVIRTLGNETIRITGNESNNSIIAFLKDYAPVHGQPVNFSDMYQGRITMGLGEVAEYSVPSDARYLFVLALDSSENDHMPVVEFEYAGLPYSIFSTGDTTDRTAEVEYRLSQFGVCRFESGRFYLKNVQMPSNSSVEGCGLASEIVLIDDGDETRTAAFIVGAECSVRNLKIMGALSSVTKSVDGLRNGVLYEGTGAGTTKWRGLISNCFFRYFTGGCVCLRNTGGRVYSGFNIENCYMADSYAGIDIPYLSEFHRVSNCSITGCHYGVLNNGGNNQFTGCSFSANDYGLAVDNSDGTRTNNTHGGMTGCILQHNHTRAVYINHGGSGFVITGCNIDTGGIEIIDACRIIFLGCNFMSDSPMVISGVYSEGTSMIMFNACNMRDTENNTYTITGGAIVKFINCYTEDGTLVDPTAT